MKINMEKHMNKKEFMRILFLDIVSAIFLGIGIDVFAITAKFAPGGVTGLSVISNYLFGTPVGLVMVILNIPIIMITYKKLGKTFLLNSIKSILICSLFIDYIICYLHPFTGSRLISSVLSGVFSGIGYSILFNENSSTGGTDFIIMMLKKWKDDLSFGFFTFVIDITVIILSVFVFKELETFIYGVVYIIITSIFMDITTFFIKKIKNYKISKYIVKNRNIDLKSYKI